MTRWLSDQLKFRQNVLDGTYVTKYPSKEPLGILIDGSADDYNLTPKPGEYFAPPKVKIQFFHSLVVEREYPEHFDYFVNGQWMSWGDILRLP